MMLEAPLRRPYRAHVCIYIVIPANTVGRWSESGESYVDSSISCRTMKNARMTDRIAGMLTIAIDVPDLAVSALAAIVRTGKVRKRRPQMIIGSLDLTVCPSRQCR